VVAGAVVAASAAIGVGLTAAPASAMPNESCETAQGMFDSHMDHARFWLGVMVRYENLGNDSMATAAAAEADYYMGLAQGDLSDMAGVC
jgi:hypothetical protein